MNSEMNTGTRRTCHPPVTDADDTRWTTARIVRAAEIFSRLGWTRWTMNAEEVSAECRLKAISRSCERMIERNDEEKEQRGVVGKRSHAVRLSRLTKLPSDYTDNSSSTQ